MNLYPFIDAEKVEQRNVRKACVMLEVSRAAYYRWSQRVPSTRALADQALTERIERIHGDSRGTYGVPRVLAQLRRDGLRAGLRRVGRLMREQGLMGRCRRRSRRTTIPDPGVPAAPAAAS